MLDDDELRTPIQSLDMLADMLLDLDCLPLLALSLEGTGIALLFEQALRAPSALSVKTLSLWLVSLLLSRAGTLYEAATSAWSTDIPLNIVWSCLLTMLSLAMVACRRGSSRRFDGLSLDYLLFVPFVFALTAGLDPDFTLTTGDQILPVIEAFGKYLAVSAWLPQLVLLEHVGSAPSVEKAVQLVWFGRLARALDGLFSLYGRVALADSHLLADMAMVLLLAEPLYGNKLLIEALALTMDKGVHLDDVSELTAVAVADLEKAEV